MDWVPRLVRSKASKLNEAVKTLEALLGRAPADAEVAAHMGLSHEEFEKLLVDANAVSLVSLNKKWCETDSSKDVREIDILEAKGQEPKRIQGALHFGGRWPANTFTVGEHFFDSGSIADFHVYALEWNPGEMHWEVDGKVYATMNSWWSTGRADEKGGVAPQAEADLNPWPAPFDKPFQVLINLAVGGKFLGNPDATTPFPAEMEVDYVRVYERTGPQPELAPRGNGKLPFAAPAR
jgi:hypothetical protein